MGEKHIFLKLRRTGEGKDEQQPSEEVMDQVGKQKVHAHKKGCAYRTALSGKLSYLSWEIGTTGYLSKVPVHRCVQQEEQAGGIGDLLVVAGLQLTGMLETWWGGSHSRSTAMGGCGLFVKDRPEGEEEVLPGT